VRITVTGATGFIGRHVITELSGRDVEVIATCRSGDPSGRLQADNVRWTPLHIHQPPNDSMDALGRPDVVLHLAWSGLPNYRSTTHLETELPAQYAFLEGLVHDGLKSLVAVGTCFEYGMQSGPLRADLETRPDNPYGRAKDQLRKQLEQLKRNHPFALTWARLFYMYGEGQSEASLFSLLRKAVSDGLPVFKMSGGEQLRDYLPVTEVAKRLTDLALGEGDLGILNVCSGQPISVRQLVEGWIEQNGWHIELELGHYPYPDHEPMEFWGVPRHAAPTGGAETAHETPVSKG